MTDIERRLRDLGERVREEQGPSALQPTAIRSVKRRRMLTSLTGLLTVAALVSGVVYGAGVFVLGPSTIPPRHGEQETTQLYADFGAAGSVTVVVHPDEGMVCYSFSGIQGGTGSYESVQIFIGDYPSRPAVLTPPSGDLNEEPCVGNIEVDVLQPILASPGNFSLQVLLPEEEAGSTIQLLAPLSAELGTKRCGRTIDLEPTYLPEGWIPDLQEGAALGKDPFDNIAGHYSAEGSPGSGRKIDAGFIDVVAGGIRFDPPSDSNLIVLGLPAHFDEENGTVEFGFGGCEYALVGAGVGREQLVPFAEGLRPIVDNGRSEEVEPSPSATEWRYSFENTAALLAERDIHIRQLPDEEQPTDMDFTRRLGRRMSRHPDWTVLSIYFVEMDIPDDHFNVENQRTYVVEITGPETGNCFEFYLAEDGDYQGSACFYPNRS